MINIASGQSYLYQVDRPISRTLVTDPQIVRTTALATGQIALQGQMSGSTDLWVWFADAPNHPDRHVITVHRDFTDLEVQLASVVTGDGYVRVSGLEDHLVVQGSVPDIQQLEQVAAVVEVFDPEFVNLISVAGDHQVQLEVVFAEMNRTALREMGLNFLWEDSSLISNADLDLDVNSPIAITEAFAIDTTWASQYDLNLTLAILAQHNLSRILAQPTLVALSGQQAEFLAGGELPIPVAQFGDRVTIEFKSFGVKVTFVPTVLAHEVIDLRVFVEVSDIDTTKSVQVTDVSIPGVSTRQSSSHLRLQSGMTFAMAGMLNESIQSSESKIPILGDLPLIGALFRHVRHERSETELMIFVKPKLVRAMGPDDVPNLPGTYADINPRDYELFLLGFGSGISPVLSQEGSMTTAQPQGPIGVSR